MPNFRKMKKTCCIVIPVYKPATRLSSSEELNVRQCLKVFAQLKFFFVHPESLDIGDYKNLGGSQKLNIEFVAFNDRFFTSDREGYNKLLTSLDFYLTFKDFHFMLLVQTDSFIFRNELDIWMEKDFDYIGGPIVYDRFETAEELKHMVLIGNGGLSLRRISTFIKLLKQNPIIRSGKRLAIQYWLENKNSPLKLAAKLISIPLMVVGFRNRLNYFSTHYNVHEDYFWCDYVAKKVKSFRVAPLEDAARFSLDGFPKEIMQVLNIGVPMGCHAWERYDKVFWEPKILEAYSLKKDI